MEKSPWDPYYIAEVLADIWGREHGCVLEITLTPKDGSAPPRTVVGGGVKQNVG